MDVFSTGKRSKVMAAIRGCGNTSTERAFVALLRSAGVTGWRRHSLKVAGKPDFYFPARRLAIFVDGCFWHGCPKCFREPQQNKRFWAEKIERNRKRDRKVTRTLRRGGIKVVRLWEHDLSRQTSKVNRVLELLRPKGARRPQLARS